jgi:hypothetical protein
VLIIRSISLAIRIRIVNDNQDYSPTHSSRIILAALTIRHTL